MFVIGDLVEVSSASPEYKHKYIGVTGVIESTYKSNKKCTMYGVRLDGHVNLNSSKGLFWFKAKSLSYSTPKITQTHESEEHFMMPNENFAAARVRFLDSGSDEPHKYLYALFDPICPGNIVVVSTGHHGFALAELLSVSEEPEDLKSVSCGREIVCCADFSNFYRRKDIRTRVADLQRKMDAKVGELHKLSVYQMFANLDPEMRGLFDEFKCLTGVTVSIKEPVSE